MQEECLWVLGVQLESRERSARLANHGYGSLLSTRRGPRPSTGRFAALDHLTKGALDGQRPMPLRFCGFLHVGGQLPIAFVLADQPLAGCLTLMPLVRVGCRKELGGADVALLTQLQAGGFNSVPPSQSSVVSSILQRSDLHLGAWLDFV